MVKGDISQKMGEKNKGRTTKEKIATIEDYSKQTFEEIKTQCNLNLTDIVGGHMKIQEVGEEILNLMSPRSPEYVVILMENKGGKTYQSTIYISKEDFKKYNIAKRGKK